MLWTHLCTGFFTLILCTPMAWSQLIQGTSQYQSVFDQGMTFRKMSFLPTVDNVNGIYARSIDETLQDLIEKDHQWNFVRTHLVGPTLKPEELVENGSGLKSLQGSLQADAVLIAEVRKDPKELKATLYLFSLKTGELVGEQAQVIKPERTPIVLDAIRDLYRKVKGQIPYDALIMSRTDNRVTINAGKRDGVQAGSLLNAVTLLSADRHPKRKFLINTKKAILGQVRVVKADDYLSFADVVTEVEPGVVDKDVKITGVSRVRHGETPWTRSYTPPETLLSEDNKPIFGSKSREWVGQTPATFGKVGVDLSLGQFSNNMGLNDGTNLDSKVSIYPRVSLNGELWITPKYYAEVSFAQGIGDASNPAGPPNEVTASLTQYRLAFGYNFLLKNEFFGPKITFDLGLSNYRMFLDSTSNNGLTTLEYRSLPIGLGGYLPIDEAGLWAVQAKAYFHLFPSLKESPFSSGGSPNNTVNQFLFNVEYKMTARFHLKGGLEFLALSTNFSGPGQRPVPATSTSHRFTFATFGIDYLF